MDVDQQQHAGQKRKAAKAAKEAEPAKKEQKGNKVDKNVYLRDSGAHWEIFHRTPFVVNANDTTKSLLVRIAEFVGVEEVGLALWGGDVENVSEYRDLEYRVIRPTWQDGIRERMLKHTPLPIELVGMIASFVPDQNKDIMCPCWPNGLQDKNGPSSWCFCKGRCKFCYGEMPHDNSGRRKMGDRGMHALCASPFCTCNCRTLPKDWARPRESRDPEKVWSYKFSVQPYGVRVVVPCSLRQCKGDIDVSPLQYDPAAELKFDPSFMGGHVPYCVKYEYLPNDKSVDSAGLLRYYNERKPLCGDCQLRYELHSK